MQNPIIARLPELAAWTNNLKSYDDLYEFSVKRPDLFWGSIARARIDWIQDFRQVCNTASLESLNDPDFRIKWFTGGKLNATSKYSTYNVLMISFGQANSRSLEYE